MDLLPVEVVLGFHRSLEILEEDMDKLFDINVLISINFDILLTRYHVADLDRRRYFFQFFRVLLNQL